CCSRGCALGGGFRSCGGLVCATGGRGGSCGRAVLSRCGGLAPGGRRGAPFRLFHPARRGRAGARRPAGPCEGCASLARGSTGLVRSCGGRAAGGRATSPGGTGFISDGSSRSGGLLCGTFAFCSGGRGTGAGALGFAAGGASPCGCLGVGAL